MRFPLREVAQALGLAAGADTVVTGWSVDSRTLQPGDLFFALRGPNHDGHAYLAEVLRKGAAAVVVDREVDDAGSEASILRVEDSLAALQTLAVDMKTAKTEGNLNNQVGLPLSLLRLDEKARVAVIEIGMNHAGEIRDLAAIARPDVGVVTNVGSAHIENFDSVEDIAAAKRELIESLPENGTAVLNADDPRVASF